MVVRDSSVKLCKARVLVFPLALLLGGCAVQLQPISNDELWDVALTDMQLIFDSQEPLDRPLSLWQAMARSLKYNLENRVALVEEALSSRSLELAKTDMLPQLAAAAGYLDRSNIDASSSQSVLTGQESLEPSTSQDQERTNADIRFTWNVLDFGVSYLQAQQDADRFLIAQSTRKKTMLRLIDQVRFSYWRAAAMQSMSDRLQLISAQVDSTLVDLEQVRSEQLRTPIAILNDIRTLLETQQQLERVRQSISQAGVQLSALVNLPPASEIQILTPSQLSPPVTVTGDMEQLEYYALSNSTEYATQMYNVRIDQLESRKGLMRLFPGLEFSYGQNYNSNSFLWNDQWGEAGIRITGDITRLIYSGRIKAYGEAREQLAHTRRLAINMAVVATVHLTWQDYNNALNRLEYARLLNEIDQEISELTANAAASRAGSESEVIQNELRAFRSEMEQMLSYAETQGAYGSLMVSLGFDPIPEQYQTMSVDELANFLDRKFQEWEEEIASVDSDSRELSLAEEA